MICRWGFALLVACMATLPGHALATEIGMVVTTTVTVTGQSVDVRIKAANNGDEIARAVTPFLALAGVETGLQAAYNIESERERTWFHSFPLGDLAVPGPGTYPLVVRLRYHDAYMYPYSMVSATGVRIGERLPEYTPIEGEMLAEQVAGEGTLDLRVRNTGPVPLDTRLTLVTPTGLVATADSEVLNLPAGEERRIGYTLRNNGSLSGSSHGVFALVEYSTGGQHGVFIMEESITVGDHVPGKMRRIVIVSAVLIVLLFFLVFVIESRTGETAA